MERLVHGIHRFQSDVFRSNKEFFEKLAGGQNPQALFITCSDSRMVPDLITQANPGDLFVHRNVGNIVPPYGVPGSEAAWSAIEYAVAALKVRDIVICGHTKCGAVRGMLYPDELKDLPAVRKWLGLSDACAEITASQYSHLSPEAKWKVAVEENVLVQLENLRSYSVVDSGLRSGQLRMHAWVYKIETGEVFTFDPESGQYQPLVRNGGSGDGIPAVRIDGDRSFTGPGARVKLPAAAGL